MVKNLILLFAVSISALMVSVSASANDNVFWFCNRAMDIAESNLRVILNKPAAGSFPAELTTPESRLASAMRLLNLEQRNPGCLQGYYGESDWAQYNTVRQLFDEAAMKYRFFY